MMCHLIRLISLCSLVTLSLAATNFTTEISAGLAYFRDLAAAGEPKILALQTAIKSGDLNAAKAAYAASRAEYEQIEVLAAAFPEVDCEIDCRAYAYVQSEGTPSGPVAAVEGEGAALVAPAAEGVSAESAEGAASTSEIAEDEFQGFHRIEALLYRDGNTAAAVKYADGLVTLWTELEEALADPAAFTFCNWWSSLEGLAFEVPAKKISSEEETYSDLSILIFYNNLLGLKNAFLPFEDQLKALDPALEEEVDQAFDTAMEVVGAFVTGNGTGFTPYSQVSIADRKEIKTAVYNLAHELEEAKALLEQQLPAPCAEEEEEEEPCENANPYDGSAEIAVGVGYFKKLITYTMPQVKALAAEIEEGASADDIKAAYSELRPIYEQLEVLAPAFPDEDAAIDSRAYGYDEGEMNVEFQGGHRLETLIYRDGLTAPTDTDMFTNTTVLAWANGLVEQYALLEAKIALLPGELAATDVFDGVLGVMTEIVAKKISSEEETWSDKSLMIFWNNWLGGYSQIKPFAITAGMEANLTEALDECLECIEPLITAGFSEDCLFISTAEEATDECLSNLAKMEFTPYSQVSMKDRECIVVRGHAFRQSIIDVANKLGVASECQWYLASKVYPYVPLNLSEEAEGEGSGVSPTLSSTPPAESAAAGVTMAWLSVIVAVAAILSA